MIEEKAVLELQQILFEEHNQKLPVEEVRNIGSKLVNLYQAVLNKNEYKWISTKPQK